MDAERVQMRELLRDILENITNDPEVLAAFVYGSRVEGFSNKYSDLDLCIITKKRKDTNFTTIQEIEVDIEYAPLEELEKMITTAATERFSDPGVLWCHRIKTGISVYDEQGIFEQLRNKVALRSVSQHLIRSYSSQAIMYLNDSMGSFESEDYETALITARLGVERAAMVYLCSINIVNPKTKWIYRYLLRENKPENQGMVEEFKTLERACAKNAEEIRKYIEKATAFVNKLTTYAQATL